MGQVTRDDLTTRSAKKAFDKITALGGHIYATKRGYSGSPSGNNLGGNPEDMFVVLNIAVEEKGDTSGMFSKVSSNGWHKPLDGAVVDLEKSFRAQASKENKVVLVNPYEKDMVKFTYNKWKRQFSPL